jgi:hypothetical protein
MAAGGALRADEIAGAKIRDPSVLLIRPAGVLPNHDRSGEIDFGRVPLAILSRR